MLHIYEPYGEGSEQWTGTHKAQKTKNNSKAESQSMQSGWAAKVDPRTENSS